MRIKLIISICLVVLLTGTSFAATLHIENSSVVVMAGQTVEIPLTSDSPIASNLSASGRFQNGDVTFTAGPGCHLSAHGCTLLITAAPTSKDYLAEPVSISEARASNIPVFLLFVLHPGEPLPNIAQLAKIAVMPLPSPKYIKPSNTVGAATHTPVVDHPPEAILQRSGNNVFYAIAEPHPSLGINLKEAATDFTQFTNGPVYQIISLTNNDVRQQLTVTISGDGANSFSLDNNTPDFGEKQNCATTTLLATGDSCLVIVKGKVGDPSQAPQKATLTIQGNNDNVATFTLTATTYVYAGGGFNTLGNASVSGGDLLAQCTQGTCSNALQGIGSGHNYATESLSVGQWINALSVTPAGNLIVGGVFGAIGGATSGATSGTAALLAQCTPGSVTGDACINQIGTGIANPYAFNNAYIDAITLPFTITSSSYVSLGGDFGNIRNISTSSGGRMLAKCVYNGASPNQSCNAYLGTGVIVSKYANNAITAVDYFNSNVSVGGLFTQIGSYPSSAPSSGTTFASCTTSTCSKGMGSNNPNGSILGMTDDGISLYMGGSFTQIGGYSDSGGGYPLVICTPATTTTCSNALSGSSDADGYIEGLTYSGGYLYVGGKFTTIGGAAHVNEGNMLAVCTPGEACSNFVTGTTPYASGQDWGGEIAAIAVGAQTSISAN